MEKVKIGILLTGSRDWVDRDKIFGELKRFTACDEVVMFHGGCRGADFVGSVCGKELGYRVVSCPAQWSIYGSRAGPIRNELMVHMLQELQVQGYECFVLAFHPDIEKSKGTLDCITRARKLGLPVEIFN
jgi:hypothetical protein